MTRIWTDDNGYIDVCEPLDQVVESLENDGGYAWFTDSVTSRDCVVNVERVVGAVDLPPTRTAQTGRPAPSTPEEG